MSPTVSELLASLSARKCQLSLTWARATAGTLRSSRFCRFSRRDGFFLCSCERDRRGAFKREIEFNEVGSGTKVAPGCGI